MEKYMEPECISYLPQNETLNKVSVDTDNQDFLVQRAISGDQSAFALLVSRHRQKLYRIIYLMVRHEEDTWDILQDTFINAYLSLSQLKEVSIFGSWIIRIAINLSINHIKKRQRIRKHQENILREMLKKQITEAPECGLERSETQSKIQELIAQLPPKQRTVLILCDIEGYSYKEISKILQCHLGTVMSRLFYARDFIRQRLMNPKN